MDSQHGLLTSKLDASLAELLNKSLHTIIGTSNYQMNLRFLEKSIQFGMYGDDYRKLSQSLQYFQKESIAPENPVDDIFTPITKRVSSEELLYVEDKNQQNFDFKTMVN